MAKALFNSPISTLAEVKAYTLRDNIWSVTEAPVDAVADWPSEIKLSKKNEHWPM